MLRFDYGQHCVLSAIEIYNMRRFRHQTKDDEKLVAACVVREAAAGIIAVCGFSESDYSTW